MKTPNEVSRRLAKVFALKKSGTQNQNYNLGILISELLGIFPKAMPMKILLEKAQNINISKDFVEKSLEDLNKEGLVLLSKDSANKNGERVLIFPSLPFKFGKMSVSKP